MEYKLFVKTKPCRKRRRKDPGELASMDPLLFLFIYGAAVQRDGAKRNRAAAWLGVPAPTVSDIQGAAVQRDGTKQNRAAAWLDAAEKSTARKAGELASRNMLRNISIYGAAVQRDGAQRNQAAAWLTGKLILLFTIRRILPYDCFRHLHPVHCSRCDAACISRAFAARIDPGEA